MEVYITSGLLIKQPGNLDDIMSIVTTVTGVSISEMKSKNRQQRIVDARQIYIHCARLYGYRTVEIGKSLNRDHSTVCHGNNKIEDMLSCGIYDDLAAKVAAVEREINRRFF